MPRAAYYLQTSQMRERLEGQPLTDEEKRVLQLVCWGYTTQEIADWIGIPERRAKYRLDTLRFKTGCGRKRDLAMYARQHHPGMFMAKPKLDS